MTVGPEGIPVRFLPGFAVAALFVAAVGIAFLLFLLLLMREGRRRLGLPVRPGFLDRPWIRWGILAMGVAGILCILYGRFVEPFWIEVRHLRLPSSKLAHGTAPLRILHFTDTHCDDWGPNEERLLAIAREEKPDLIAFTGDACNNPDCGYKAFQRLLGGLDAPYGCYAVRGNWDVWYWDHLPLFEGSRFQELSGESRLLEVRGTPVAVAGLAYDQSVGRLLEPLPTQAFTILLYHTPDLIRDPEIQRADLYLAGHTHGGQVCLPFYGAMVTMSKYGKAYEAGLYRNGACRMYVSRGTGMEGGFMPRVRFCCRPEVVVIEVVPEE